MNFSSLATIFIVGIIFLGSFFTIAQNAGNPDLTFGGTGYVTTSAGTLHSFGYAMEVQTDNKIVVGGYSIQNGYSANTLIRYNTDGSFDNSFGNNGMVVTQTGLSSHINSIAIQNDNKILAAGITNIDTSFLFTVIRYNPDGTLDNSFGNNGVTLINVENSSNCYNAALKSNGQILVSGYCYKNFNTGIALVQINGDGMLDTNFGTGGISIHHFSESPDIEAWAMALDGDEKIVTTGMYYDSAILRSKISVCRFNSDGSRDSSFGTGGLVISSAGVNTDDFGNAIVIQSNNKIVVAGTSNNYAVISRYNINGSPDSTFATGNGMLITRFENTEPSEAYGITISNNGNIIVTGVSGSNAMNTNGNFALLRLNPDGTSDNSFGTNGRVITDVSNGHNDVAFSVKELSDERIAVSGISMNNYYRFAVALYIGSTLQTPVLDIMEDLNIFPNPADDLLFLTGAYKGVIEIYSTKGQKIFSLDKKDGFIKADISELPNGLYYLKANTDNGVIVKKFIKE